MEHSLTPDSTKFVFENNKIVRWDKPFFPPKYEHYKFFLMMIDHIKAETTMKPLTHELFDHLYFCNFMGDDPIHSTPSIPICISMNSMFEMSGVPVVNVLYSNPPFVDNLKEMNEWSSYNL